MPPAFNLFASTPDALAQQQQNYDRFYLGAAEANRAAATQVDQFNLQNWIRAQQEDAQARERENATRINLAHFAAQDRDRASQLNIGTALEKERLANDRERIASIGRKQESEQENFVAKEKLKANAEAASIQETLAKQHAQEGLIEDEADAKKKYPLLTPDLWKVYAFHSKTIRDALKERFKNLDASAQTLNDADRIKNYVRLSKEAVKDMPAGRWSAGLPGWRGFFGPYREPNPELAYEGKRIRDWEAMSSQDDPSSLGSRSSRILADKDLMAGLTVDPRTGEMIPAERPAWLPQTSATGNTVASAPIPSATDLIAEANAAIAAGANPEAVRARLLKLGVKPQ